MVASLPQREPGRGSGRGLSPSAPIGAACEPEDAPPGAPQRPAPACETRHGPGNLLPVVSGRVLVGDAVPPGEVAVGAAGPHGPGAQGQLAGLQPCRRAGGVPLLRPAAATLRPRTAPARGPVLSRLRRQPQRPWSWRQCPVLGWPRSGSRRTGRPVGSGGEAARTQDRRTEGPGSPERACHRALQDSGVPRAGPSDEDCLVRTGWSPGPAKPEGVAAAAAWRMTRPPGPTWHVLPVGAHGHLLGDPHSHVHIPPAVQGPQHLVVGAGVDADQGDPGGLEAERACPQGRSWWDTLLSKRAKPRGVENWGR